MGDVPEFEENEDYYEQCQDCGDSCIDPIIRCRECDAARDVDIVKRGQLLGL